MCKVHLFYEVYAFERMVSLTFLCWAYLVNLVVVKLEMYEG